MESVKEKDLRRKTLGNQGEEIAAGFLARQGCIILDRNIRRGHKELDIVCLQMPVAGQAADSSGVCLRFVEVKTRKEPVEGEAWEAVNSRKQRNLAAAASAYIASDDFHARHIRYDEIFFDILTIVWNRDATAYTLDYIPDAFRVIRV